MAAEAALKAESPDVFTDEHVLGVRKSLSGRAWRLRARDRDAERGLALSGVNAALAQVLSARGVTRETLENFLEPRLKTSLPDPYLFANMERAARRFADAVEANETIAVFGDYDVDGACSSALLFKFLRALRRNPLLYIPDRMTEGYGPSAGAMRRLREKGATLAVTVDCGAAAHEALAAARDVGLDAIVLDHHAVDTNPPVFAHVNPNGPDDRSGFIYVCATGLTFLFLVAVQRRLREDGWFADQGLAECDLMAELDLVALATVADVVPLTGLNRAFVRQGLKRLERLERPGLAALAKLASSSPPFSSHSLGFVFGPRINAGGRVGRCDLGARLLATGNADEAETLAAELDRHNRERQALESMILESAQGLADAQRDNPFLLLAGDGWHAGVVGIIAGRLKDRHGKPAFVAGFEDAHPQSLGRGSARSIPGVDLGAIVRAALQARLLETGGGHAMAAGFSIRRDKLSAFDAFLRLRIEPERDALTAAAELLADGLVSASGATLDLLADLDRAGPYGAGNPEPLFLLPDMLVAYADVVGTGHVKLRLTARDGGSIGAIAFRAAGSDLGQGLLKSRGKRLHAAGKLKRDDYGGTPKVQLILEDAAPAGA
jgi:single-stranded-DNA-specific exonuclease